MEKCMKIKRINGYTQIINLTKIKNNKRENCSIGHRIMRKTLNILFPLIDIYEEVFVDGLYLDFFVPSLGLIIEIDGVQHDKYIEFFHKSAAGFMTSIKNDDHKKALADLNNFKLLRIKDKDIKTLEKAINIIKENLNGSL